MFIDWSSIMFNFNFVGMLYILVGFYGELIKTPQKIRR
jgi:hypothetical protein